jgi:hypothetical protein
MKRTALGLLAGALLASAWPGPVQAASSDDSGETVGMVIQAIGETPVQRPDASFQRGTIIAVKLRDPFSGDILCRWDQVLKPIQARLHPSTEGAATPWQAATDDTTFDADADAVKQVNAKLGLQAVKSIKFTFTNTAVYDLTDADVREAASAPAPAACLQAIQQRLRDKQVVTILDSSMVADARYKIGWEDGVAAEQQAQLTPKIAEEIAAGLQGGEPGALTGNLLVYGVTDSTGLLLTYIDAQPRTAETTEVLDTISRALSVQNKTVGQSALKP